MSGMGEQVGAGSGGGSTQSGSVGEALDADGFFRRVVDMSIDVVTVLDDQAVIVYESPSVEQILGYRPEALLGRSVLDYINPDDRPLALEAIGRLLRPDAQPDATEQVELRFEHGAGGWRDIEAVGRRWVLEGRALVLVNTRDITERRAMMQALARSNELLSTTLRASRNVVSISRTDTGEFRDVNDEWLRVSGYRREEVVGRTANELGIWGSVENRDRVMRELAEAGGRLTDYAVTAHTPNGPRQLVVNVEPLTVADEPLILMIGADETESRLTEEKLRQSQKMEALGQLTGGVAHDFNNLLGVVLGNAELLQEALGEDSRLRRMVGTIIEAAERGATVTGQLLAFARRQMLDPRPVRIDDAVAAMLPLLRTTLGAHVRLQFVSDGDLPLALVDAGQLENALLNLVVNARDAMPDGGSIRVVLDQAAFGGAGDDAELQDLPAGRYLRLAVEDDGTGIEPEVLAHVFEPFFTTKAPGRGTGLGLSMVFGFARQSGGTLTVHSEPGAGTRMSLWLPAAATVEELPDGPIDAGPPRGNGETILVLEDQPELLRLIHMLLEPLDYRVIEVPGEGELMALLAAGTDFDMIVSDVFLAGPRRGPELVAEVRRQRPDIAVLYISGYPADALEGAVGPEVRATLLSKPFTRQRLAAALRDALEQRDR